MSFLNVKKVLPALALVFMSAPLFAMSPNGESEITTKESVVVSAIDGKIKAECTATATVSVPGGSKIELSATAPTCAEAIRMVRAGVASVLS